jgi:hypothetical protein
MLSLGYQLYELTDKDLLTVQLEPLFRRLSFSLGVGVSSGQVLLTPPADRALFVAGLTWIMNAEAATRWVSASCLLQGFTFSSFSSSAGLNFSGNPAAIGEGGSVQDRPGIILPAGSGSVVALFSRFGTTGIATGELDVVGYLIPPGTMTRGFS